MRMLPVLALGLTAACWPARDVTHVMVAGRDVAVWKPAGPAPPAGYPMIVFSHGFTGCNTQSVFFTEALAAAGYLVVAPNHADGRCGTARRSAGGFSVSRPQPEASFGDAKSWSDSTYRDRLTDIRTILDTILRTPTWNGVPVDAQRIGIAGHSLGGEELSSVGSRHPERVAGLIYLDAGYSYAYYDRSRGDLGIDLADLQKKLEQLQPGKGPEDPRHLIEELLATTLPGFERDLKEMQKNLPVAPSAQATLAQVPPITQAIMKGRQKYTDIRVPVLAIYALPDTTGQPSKDDEERAAQAKAIETGVPSARVVRLPHANHYVFLSNEADVLREMLDFSASLH